MVLWFGSAELLLRSGVFCLSGLFYWVPDLYSDFVSWFLTTCVLIIPSHRQHVAQRSTHGTDLLLLYHRVQLGAWGKG